jgi:ABC-type lipoprotein release transport system permease subunit
VGVGGILYRLRCHLRSQRLAVAGLTAVVAVTVAVVLTLVAGTVRTLSAPDRYSASRPTRLDITVEQSSGRPRTAELGRLAAVEDARSATFVFGAVVPSGSGLEEAANAIVFAGPPNALGLAIVDGRAPDPAVAREFAATRSFVESTGAELGDRFVLWVIPAAAAEVAGFEAEDQATPVVDATLVAVLDGPSELQNDYGLAMFPMALLDAADMGVAATQMGVALTPGSTLDDLRDQLDELDDPTQFGLSPGDWVPREVRAAVRAYGQGLAVLAAIAAVATVVVVGQLLGRQVRLPDDERRVLRSIGMSRPQIVGDQLAGAAVATVLGAAGGVVLAYLASGLFPNDFVRHVEPHPGRRLEAVAVLGGATVVAAAILGWVLVAVVVSSRPGRRADQVSAIEALARWLPRRVATALRLGFTRQRRDTTRPAAAVVGASAVVGVLVGAMTFGASLGDLLDRPARWGHGWDLTVGEGGGEPPPELRAALESDPDITDAALLGTVLASVGSGAFDVTGTLPVRGSTAPHVFSGRLADSPDEIALGRVAARRFGVGIGDDISIVGPVGPHVMTVTGLAVIPGAEGGDGVGEGGLVTFEGLRRIDPSAVPTAAVANVRGDVPVATVADRLAAATGLTVGRGFDPPGVILNAARVRSVPYVVAGVLAALLVLSVAHHLILLTWRRRREIAVLQALGADGRWVTAVVHWQASLFTLLVVALGAPLGFVGGRVVYRAFVGRMGALETVTLPLGLLVLVAAGLLILANVVAAPSAVRARRRPPSRLLREE